MKAIALALAGLVLLATHQTNAQTPTAQITVSSLINQGYELAGTISTASGAPGLFMRNRTRLYLCFIAETPQSKTVATQYCKPVE